jgi:hypothetical protein
VATLTTGILLFIGFHALGLGPALLLRRRLALPQRFLGPLTAACTAAVSYAVFWIALIAPGARLAAVALFLVASLAVAAAALRSGQLRPALIPASWLPPVLGGVLAVVYLAPVITSGPDVNHRLTWTLPSDNVLPGLFAWRIVQRGDPTVPAPPLKPGADQATERPPLQAAVVVAVGSMVRGDEYQLIATLCQAQWLPSLLLVGIGCGLGRPALIVTMAACALSGFFFVNTIYTWPKLFAASLMLGAFAIALEPPPDAADAARARTIAIAVLCTLALLAHPGPGFTLVAIAPCWPLLRPLVRLRPGWPSIAWAGAAAALVLAPWLAYETFIDPPTGVLLRQHFAGGRADGPIAAAMLNANLERPLAAHVEVRLANLVTLVGNPLVVLRPKPHPGQAEQFFHHGASLGVLLVGLVVALLPWPEPLDAAADAVRRLALAALVALLLWAVLVFEPGNAVIHHGSPVTTALLFFAGAYGLTRLAWPLQLAALSLHALAFFLIWFIPVATAAGP